MREFKFRAWKKEKKMFYFDFYDLIDEEVYFDKSERIMQFTGLHDKNNKPIFEGDIVKLDYKDYLPSVLFVIEWDKKLSGFEPFIHIDNPSVRFATEPECMEVIGNKFEDKELEKELLK